MATSQQEGTRRIAVTGASGFLGSALVESLRRDGHQAISLVRRAARPGANEIEWHPARGQIDAAGLEGVDAVVHLASENIDGRWTDEKKRRLIESRVTGTRLIASTLASLASPPEVLVSASAIGIYGADRGDERLDESSALGTDFLGSMGTQWEAAAEPALIAGIRVAHPRFGLILGQGGALQRMLPFFRLGLGGRLGSGRNWMSWISLEDAVRAVRFAIEHRALEGPFNTVAPEPVTNATFTEELGRALHRPTPWIVPRLALDLLFGEMAEGTVLASQKVYPDRLLQAGFDHRHPQLGQALAAVFGSGD